MDNILPIVKLSLIKANMEFAELIRISRCDRVMLHQPHKAVLDGTLCITGHHLIVSSRDEEPQELWLLHSNIDTVERRQQGMTGGTLWLKCKDLRILQLDIIGADQFAKVSDTLEDLTRVDEPTLLYPFFYRPMYTVLEDGWTAFLPESEFSRLVQSGDDWRMSYVNKDYKVSLIYTSALSASS
ncbi:myotubularin-related protein 9-like isoform X1 [Oratosquilla oratoria]|uniref:myotubularin-related protein 9-like isoform X1 n=2 Tax=Oratosquilla oratoria TaxID=337810 RepID=UPI003F76825A